MEKLLDSLNLNPDLARGRGCFGNSKARQSEKWAEIASELNSLGPPTRSTKEWQRVWIHYKANLKRKLAQNKANFTATGGGPSTEIPLNALEQSAMELLSMEKQVFPSGVAFGLIENVRQEENITPDPQTIESEVEPATPCSKAGSRRLTKKSLEEERLELLKKQISNQEEIIKNQKKMEKLTYKRYDLEKQQLQLAKKPMPKSKCFEKPNWNLQTKKFKNWT